MINLGFVVRTNMLDAYKLFRDKVGENNVHEFKNEDNIPSALFETRHDGIQDLTVLAVRFNKKGRFDFKVAFECDIDGEEEIEWIDEIAFIPYTVNNVYEALDEDLNR